MVFVSSALNVEFNNVQVQYLHYDKFSPRLITNLNGQATTNISNSYFYYIQSKINHDDTSDVFISLKGPINIFNSNFTTIGAIDRDYGYTILIETYADINIHNSTFTTMENVKKFFQTSKNILFENSTIGPSTCSYMFYLNPDFRKTTCTLKGSKFIGSYGDSIVNIGKSDLIIDSCDFFSSKVNAIASTETSNDRTIIINSNFIGMQEAYFGEPVSYYLFEYTSNVLYIENCTFTANLKPLISMQILEYGSIENCTFLNNRLEVPMDNAKEVLLLNLYSFLTSEVDLYLKNLYFEETLYLDGLVYCSEFFNVNLENIYAISNSPEKSNFNFRYCHGSLHNVTILNSNGRSSPTTSNIRVIYSNLKMIFINSTNNFFRASSSMEISTSSVVIVDSFFK